MQISTLVELSEARPNASRVLTWMPCALSIVWDRRAARPGSADTCSQQAELWQLLQSFCTYGLFSLACFPLYVTAFPHATKDLPKQVGQTLALLVIL